MAKFEYQTPRVPPAPLTLRGQTFAWGERTYLMGVLNVTPDSFSDGGDFENLGAAIAQAQALVAAGADILDIGGQSTRPGAPQVSLDAELNRVIPVIEGLRSHSEVCATVPISVDTTRAEVAQAAIAAGADLINDISGATFDPQMLNVVAHLQVPLILMHLRGTPQTMQTLTDYEDLIGEICQFLATRIDAAIAAGIKRSHLLIDPGIGFAKTYAQNLQILRELSAFQALGCGILVGPSRKSFIGRILDRPEPKERVWGTAAACCAAIAAGADIIRVHDVREMADVCRVADAIWRKSDSI